MTTSVIDHVLVSVGPTNAERLIGEASRCGFSTPEKHGIGTDGIIAVVFILRKRQPTHVVRPIFDEKALALVASRRLNPSEALEWLEKHAAPR